MDQYRDTLAALIGPDGELSDDSAIEMVGLQAEYGIDADQARRILQEVRASITKFGRVQ
jgi:hypothetical protein